MMIPSRLVEDYDEPDVVAGHVIAAYLRAEAGIRLIGCWPRPGRWPACGF